MRLPDEAWTYEDFVRKLRTGARSAIRISAQDDSHPSRGRGNWNDARVHVRRLSWKTGKRYRLLF